MRPWPSKYSAGPSALSLAPDAYLARPFLYVFRQRQVFRNPWAMQLSQGRNEQQEGSTFQLWASSLTGHGHGHTLGHLTAPLPQKQ